MSMSVSAIRPPTNGRLERRSAGRAGLFALVAVLALGACGGSSTPTAQAKFKIVYASPLPNSADWKRSADYLQTWAASHNATVSVVGPANTVDIPTIVNDILTAIPQKPDMILTCACQGGAFDEPLAKAKAAGIITVTLAADSVPSSRDVFLGTNYQNLGKSAADSLIQKMGGHARIGVVQQNGTVANQVAELQAFQTELQSQPDMKVVQQVFDNSDAATAQQKISEMLLAHPEINVIWTLEGISPAVMESILKQANKKPGDITVLAIDLQPPVFQAITDGYIWATEYQQFFDATPLAAQCALDIKQGKKPASDVIDTGALLVTKDNLPSSLPPPGEKLPAAC